jgi:hypothetical protein
MAVSPCLYPVLIFVKESLSVSPPRHKLSGGQSLLLPSSHKHSRGRYLRVSIPAPTFRRTDSPLLCLTVNFFKGQSLCLTDRTDTFWRMVSSHLLSTINLLEIGLRLGNNFIKNGFSVRHETRREGLFASPSRLNFSRERSPSRHELGLSSPASASPQEESRGRSLLFCVRP